MNQLKSDLTCPHGPIPQGLENICGDLEDLARFIHRIKWAVQEVELSGAQVDEFSNTTAMLVHHLTWVVQHTPAK